MFTAVVVACHITNAMACIQFTDNRGPYKTMERCEARIEEMLGDIIKCMLRWVHPFYLRSLLAVRLLQSDRFH